MKIWLMVIALSLLTGCATISETLNQAQTGLETANMAKGMEAREMICRRLYTATFSELFQTSEARAAWRVICVDSAEAP
jgi:hypothetical protein